MNSSDITIEDVNLQLEKSGTYIEGKVQIIITLKNKKWHTIQAPPGLTRPINGKK